MSARDRKRERESEREKIPKRRLRVEQGVEIERDKRRTG